MQETPNIRLFPRLCTYSRTSIWLSAVRNQLIRPRRHGERRKSMKCWHGIRKKDR